MAVLSGPGLYEARVMFLTWSWLCLVIHADCLWLAAAMKTAGISGDGMFGVLGCD
jgi:uncharacterized membrane protein YvlD (DUF360 family)